MSRRSGKGNREYKSQDKDRQCKNGSSIEKRGWDHKEYGSNGINPVSRCTGRPIIDFVLG
jgi:hypothetical protein